MTHPVKLTAPESGPRRTVAVNIRLTPDEYKQVEFLADHLHVRVATLARHFLIQAVQLFNDQAPSTHNPSEETL